MNESAALRNMMLSAIVESSHDAIISKNLQGIIMSWNKGAEAIFGYTEDEVLGKSITILIPESKLQEEDHILASIRANRKIEHFETVRIRKDKSQVSISLTVSPVKDPHGNIIGASKIARDITAQIQAQAEVRKYAARLEILNSISRSISESMDIDTILQRVTDQTSKLTGAAVCLFHPTFSGNAVVRVDDITKDPENEMNAVGFGLPEEALPVISYMAVPVISNNGSIIGGLFFGHPEPGVFLPEHEDLVIAVAAQAAIALDNSRLFAEVQELSRKKDEFIALATHELKTPLTSLKGYLQMLGRKMDGHPAELFVRKSVSQTDRLTGLVDDLLHMSRIQAGKLEFNFESFDLRALMVDIAETFSYQEYQHVVICELEPDAVVLLADGQRIEQAILNLMTNAVKYSPQADKIYLGLHTTGGHAVISVRDEGMGLTPEQVASLFTRFYRTETARGISGLGLGLYLTKEIIDRHQGRIEVKSEPGKGSQFDIWLPLA
ncbi:ATP-binding protein [Pedobacter sp. JY14-1]|uniref:sensor histidine kinase n=1 Tax=Pedobacter sp. JY14-1 TaxID=3034151 RepID=UPI0023E0ADAF|nr:ATP-binding protein [Pedobacter sp. JY14-1]